jgi:hypothetical protein
MRLIVPHGHCGRILLDPNQDLTHPILTLYDFNNLNVADRSK